MGAGKTVRLLLQPQRLIPWPSRAQPGPQYSAFPASQSGQVAMVFCLLVQWDWWGGREAEEVVSLRMEIWGRALKPGGELDFLPQLQPELDLQRGGCYRERSLCPSAPRVSCHLKCPAAAHALQAS